MFYAAVIVKYIILMKLIVTVARDRDSEDCYVLVVLFIMAALHSRCGRHIFALWFLLLIIISFLSSPNLSRCRLDVYHTSTHGVALVQI